LRVSQLGKKLTKLSESVVEKFKGTDIPVVYRLPQQKEGGIKELRILGEFARN
jgi:hypothetical protein